MYSKAGLASTGSFRAFFHNKSLTTGCSGQFCVRVGKGTKLESAMVSRAIFLLEAIKADMKEV